MLGSEDAMTPTVVIVDDDLDVREALEMVVGLAGFPVVACPHGGVALAHLRGASDPCIVILDLMMPVIDGWEVLEVVQAENLLPLSRILVLTASRDPALPDGVRLLPKPMTVDAIIAAIRAAAAA
jgi:two-component system, chemotaxis family, chemotaxis protein CheY